MWDLQIHKPEIIQQVSWEQKSPQDVLNSAIEKQKQVIIEWIKQKLLEDWITQEKINTLKFDVVWDIWIVINSKWEIHSFYKYSKNSWVEFMINVFWLKNDSMRDINFALEKSWLEQRNWKFYRSWKEVNWFLANWSINPDFVKEVRDLIFYVDARNVFWLMKSVYEWDKINLDISPFYLSIVTWVTRIKDVMYFYSKWYIPQKDFERLLVRAIQELPNQCSDTRFNNLVLWERDWKKVMMVVTKEELDEYLKPTKWTPLITQKMYDDCLRRIEARDRKINEMNWVKEWTKWEIKVEKTRNWFVDRVKWILGF